MKENYSIVSPAKMNVINKIVFYLYFGRQPVIGQKDKMLHKQIVFYTEAAELKLSHGWMDTHNKSTLCDVK